ncbi:MAG: hypothetical protein FJW30_01275 [Acidobacteria bacterium]|nr:hypothetical protein [Acidobacteriota bacterium]
MRAAALILTAGLWAATDGTTALHKAAHADDAAKVKALLAQGLDPKAANRYGMTPLALGCENGNAEIVELLLKAGADPNAALPGGETALMTAARTGKTGAMKALLKAGANVHAKDDGRGQTALVWAAAEGHAEAVALLIEFGADYKFRLRSGFSTFLLAVRNGRTEVVNTLLKAGANPNDVVSERSGPGPREGISALTLAVINGHFDLASRLLDAGADPNHMGSGFSALHVLTDVRKPGVGDNDPGPIGSGRMTSLELIRKLKEKGANLNARMTKKVNIGATGLNTLGSTPFLLAARSADVEMLKLLAELGANTNEPNEDKSTPLIVCAGLGTRSPGEDAGTEEEVLDALKLLLELGNDINAVNANGETAMHGAAYKNYPKVVEYLHERGANPVIWNQKNKFGWTPLRIAEGYRFGNFKPSLVTVEAFQRVMKAGGIAAIPYK